MESLTAWAANIKHQVDQLQADGHAEYKRMQVDYEHSQKAFSVLHKDIQVATTHHHPHMRPHPACRRQARLYNPYHHAKAARVMQRMQEAGYSDEQVNDVVRGTVTTHLHSNSALQPLISRDGARSAGGVVERRDQSRV